MNLAIKNLNGMLENVVSIRYFKFNGANYLIFTKNEIDESGYQKLYISKINDMIGNSIADEVEWNLVRDTIKVIAKANKEGGSLPISDLDEGQLNGIQIIGQKPFKLTAGSVSLLAANKKVDNSTNEINFSNPPTSSALNVGNTVNVTPVAPAQPVFPETPVAQTVMPNVISEEIATVTPAVENISVPQQSLADFSAPNMVPESQKVDVVPNQPTSDVVINHSVDNAAFPNSLSFEQFVNTTVPAEPESPVIDNGVPAAPAELDFALPQKQSIDQPMPEQTIPTVDYKQLYEEQTLKLNNLTAELNNYKNIVEQLKNILK